MKPGLRVIVEVEYVIVEVNVETVDVVAKAVVQTWLVLVVVLTAETKPPPIVVNPTIV